jgi:hypothetical protein
MVAGVTHPCPVKIGISSRPPMVGRVMDEDVPKVAGNKARRRRGTEIKSKCYARWAGNREQADHGARPRGRANELVWRLMVAIVDLRENRRVMKEHAMQQIFEQCPGNQPGAVDNRPGQRMRRRRTAKREERGDKNERREKQKLGKIAELAHFHGVTLEAVCPAIARCCCVRRPRATRDGINKAPSFEERSVLRRKKSTTWCPTWDINSP